jgi:hypothetical protein
MMMDQMRSTMISRGSDPVTATQQTHGMLFGIVQRQATMLSFIDVMRLFGILFVVVAPLILLARPPHTGKR